MDRREKERRERTKVIIDRIRIWIVNKKRYII